MNRTTNRRATRTRRAVPGTAFLAALLALAGCDFELTNPGPIQDENVDDPAAHPALVTGAMKRTLEGLSDYAYWGGAITRDHVAGGHTGSNGVPDGIELGQLHDEQTQGGGWDNSHEARWMSEHMISRITENMGGEADAHKPLGRFYLWAGFANRTLGENACSAVFEESGPEPYLNYFSRAVEHFNNAERVAGAAGDEEARMAAIAARASAHLHLGNWAEAVTDASQVPADFSFQAAYNTEDVYSYVGAASTTFRSITLWDSAVEDYFLETGDPRVAWGHDPNEEPQVARATYGFVVPMYYPLKWYRPRNEDELTVFQPVEALQEVIPVDLADGREMLLIRAEALLIQGDWQGAMELINEVRTTAFDPGTGQLGSYFTGEPLAPVTAASAEEAWTALKFERLVELNMEGRRMGDRKRWAVGEAPGALHPKEYLPDNHVQKYGVSRFVGLCFPMEQEEKDENPFVADDFEETVIRDAG